jgi:hypothetical protein
MTPSTEPASRITVAVVANHEVRMVTDMRCPACERQVWPHDFDIDNRGQLILLICRTCHRDMLRIEEVLPRVTRAAANHCLAAPVSPPPRRQPRSAAPWTEIPAAALRSAVRRREI